MEKFQEDWEFLAEMLEFQRREPEVFDKLIKILTSGDDQAIERLARCVMEAEH